MSLLRDLTSTIERRAATLAAPSQWLLEAMTPGGKSYSGKTVSVQSAMELIPVYSAVSLISGATAQLELEVFAEAPDGTKTPARATRQWELLHEQPNDEMAADELQEIVQAHLLLWGNAFLYKERDGLGLVKALWPIAPSRVLVGRELINDGSATRRYFLINDVAGGVTKFYEDEILQIRGLGSDGLVGYSPIQTARQQLGNQLALEEFAGRFWAEGAHLSGLLIHPNTVSDQAANRLARRFKRAYTGVRKAGRIAVLEEDVKWQTVGMPMADAQFVETAELGDRRIAQLFRVPPRLLMTKTGDSMTYATVEGEGIDFVRWCLGRWAKRIEKSYERDPGINPPVLGQDMCFSYDALERGDRKTRMEANKLSIEAGIETRNEIRADEGRPPIDGGDVPGFPAGTDVKPKVEHTP